MKITPVSALELAGKRVLVRCDFNVPLKEGVIADPARIDASLETIRHIMQHGGAAILCSHLGRPKERTPGLSLKPVAAYLTEVLGRKVALAPDCIGEVTGRMVETLPMGEALLLENLRFHPEEEANAKDFAHELARGKHVYVNDAFGTAHRAHASTVGVVAFIPERAAGFLMMRELAALHAFTDNPERPLVAILGGAKVSDKIGVIRRLLTKVNALLIGGAMAYTFLKARGIAVGRSRVEDDKLELALQLMSEAANRQVAFVLPLDHLVAYAPEAGAVAQTVTQIPPDMMALDIGPRTVDEFCNHLATARTVIWNGPLGYFELPAFAQGTLRVGEAIANHDGLKSLIGGGDTAAAIAGAPWAHRFTHISTGGGATLEYLEGLELPGVKALEG
ncbi:MAG TPA: phosphoglycerate kinase [Candidatus Binataceae bacterium]|nr:phosphoglycerate kinase [Candidatus Binataceae bacterium]